VNRNSALTPLLCALFLPAALAISSCGEPDQSEVPAPDDDDDATEDDGTPRISFEPGVVQAGSLEVVFTTLHNFELGDDATACCSDDNVRFYRTEEMLSEQYYDFLFYFGLRGEGTAEWGLETDGMQVVGEFEIEPIGDVPELAPGLAAGTGSLAEEGAFDVFTFEVLEPNSLVSIQASNMTEDQHPWLWVFEDDGITTVINAGFLMMDVYEAPAVGFWAEEPGTYWLRIDENDDGAGGNDWVCDIDLLIQPAGDTMPHSELEPNDVSDGWQDLGTFEPGVHQVTGVAATAGHDADNDLTGDLDVFWFRLEEPAFVEFELDWAGGDDLDVLLYQGTPSQVYLGYGSDQAISYAMASTEKPESTSMNLPAGNYVVEVGNWEGDPETAWSIDLRVIPMSFDEGSR
jgi:hypothetical protein